MDSETPFREQLFAAGLLIQTGIDGLYGRSGTFEHVVDGLEAMVTRIGAADQAEIMRFPPALNRNYFEQTGYLKGFPHFAGTIHCFCGNERDHRELLRCVDAGEDWTGGQRASDIVLTPAACYPIYPTLAARGALSQDGALVDVSSYCFRHEPSLEPTRQQLFRMREHVRVGTPDQLTRFREMWMERGRAAMRDLCLPHEVDAANDPFFGRAGQVLAESQRQQALKFEMLIPVNSKDHPTACMSFNYHLDHFGQICGLRLPDGAVAHSGCVAFGLERLALALFRHHGLVVSDWPQPVRAILWP